MASLSGLIRRLPKPVVTGLQDAIYPDLLPEGETAPEWHLQSYDNSWHRMKNQWNILVFYPGDDTPGCTAQLSSFQEQYAEIKAVGAEVYAINPAEAPSHRSFAEKFGFAFPILTDRGASVARQFRCSLPIPGTPKVIRTVYLVNPERKIRLANRGAPSVAAILRSMLALQQATKDGR